MKKLVGIFSLFFISFAMAANPQHEWDIAGAPQEIFIQSTKIKADKIESQRSSGSTSYSFILEKNQQRTIIEAQTLAGNEECTHQQTLTKKIKLEDTFFKIQDDWNIVYELTLSLKCDHHNQLIFQHDSVAGQVMGIYAIVTKAFSKFQSINRESFWNRKLNLIFPADGDYYSYRSVHLTKGHYWDVVGHELGHAIYDMADIGVSAGGAHRIDECYTDALAISEGWASFFSAWVSVELNDPDAKFEYMVKRRAPLEIEHVPSDVCIGTNNEWRVYTFLWDIIDTNQDNESLNQSFQSLWDLTIKKNFTSVEKMKMHLLSQGYDPVLLNVVYDQNILGR